MKPSLVSPLTSIFLVEAVIQRCSMKLVIISPTPTRSLPQVRHFSQVSPTPKTLPLPLDTSKTALVYLFLDSEP